MREYGQVQSAFWQSADFESWSDTGRLLALYLMTGPHTNGLGCFRMTDGYVMDDLNWSTEKVSEGFAELSRNGFAYRYERVIFIPNFLRWNRIANGNVAKARFGEFDALPKGEAKTLAARAMLRFCGFWDQADRTVIETVAQTVTETVCQTEPNPTQPRENPTQSKAAGKKPPAAAEPMPDLPDWIDPEAWNGFAAMRRRERHPLTPRAAKLVLAELEKLQTAGHDPTTVLDQSTRNGWRDVYAVKPATGVNGSGHAAQQGLPIVQRQRRELGT